MKISYNWLGELVNHSESPEELGRHMTMSGLEVESVEKIGEDINGIVVGYVTKVQDHPNAEKLSVCSIDIGADEDIKVVCGANNVSKGKKVPVAVSGAILPNGTKIKKSKIIDVESNGMICSAQEIGIDDSLIPGDIKDGIWILDDDAPVGRDFKRYASLDDVIFEVGLTPNRSDCLGMINVAREVKAIVNGELTLPDISLLESENSIVEKASVEIKASDLCPRYSARLVENVKIKPSPEWLKSRLRNCGVRPINNVVDVTNYVMLEMGQPLHAFDYNLLSDHKIIVRRAKEGEKIQSLDGIERELTADMLVIADAEKPVAIAGVMGGADTEVTEKTQNILLESANFNPVNVRHTSKKLGLRSESSIRFERGVDRSGTVSAVDRAAQLLVLIADGEVASRVIDEYPKPVNDTIIDLRLSKTNDLLGVKIEREKIVGILNKLSFKIEEVDDNKLRVHIPSYRLDITQEIDLVEEIARLYGYDNIIPTLPVNAASGPMSTKENVIKNKIKQSFISSGFFEVITYSFINPKGLEALNLADDSTLKNYIEVSNPLSEEHKAMRTTLVPGILEVASKNTNRRINSLAIFEIGNIFKPLSNNELPEESEVVCALGMGSIDHGWKWGEIERDFYYCKGVLEQLFQELGIKVDFERCSDNVYLHPGKSAKVMVEEKKLGYIGEIHPKVMEKFDLDEKPCILELDLGMIVKLSTNEKNYISIPRYPGVIRDLAIVVKDDVPSSSIEDIINKYGKPLISSIKLFDVYRGEQVPEGCKSLAYSLYYQSKDKTLTDGEVSRVHNSIRKQLEEKLGAKLR